MNKKVTSLLLVFSMLFCIMATAMPAYAASSNEFIIIPDKTEAYPGDTITYTAMLGPIKNFQSANFTLIIPDGLTFVSGAIPEGLKELTGATEVGFEKSTLTFYHGGLEAYRSDTDTVLMTFTCTVNSDAMGDYQVDIMDDWDFGDSSWTTYPDMVINTAASKITVKESLNMKLLRLDQEYVALKKGQSTVLSAQVLPEELAVTLSWSVESGGETVAAVDSNGTITALSVGTAYILATASDGETTLTARCRVDVSEDLTIDGIQLSTQKLTTELYSTDYAGFEILLLLPQNYAPTAATYSLRSQNTGVAIESAKFTDPALAELFEIVVQDGRSVILVPTDYAVENPGEVKSSYTGSVTVTVQGREYTSEDLTLTVKKSTPKLKATVPAFNSFYSGQSLDIAITGGTVTAISEDTSKNTDKTSAIPSWLTLENGTLTLTEDAPLKNASGKAYILADTEEWRIPAALTLTVKNTYKAPGLKLSAATVTLTTLTENSDGVSLKLQCKNKKDTLSSLNVSGITAPEGYLVENFNSEDGSFTLKAQEGFLAGKIVLNVTFSDTSITLPLPLTVKTAAVTLKTSAKSLSLNTAVGDSAVISITATPTDYRITALSIRLTDTKGNDKTGELDIRYEDGQINILTTDSTPVGASYKLWISAGDSKEAVISIKTISAVPSVTFKVIGSVDLSFPDQTAKIIPTFRNYNGAISSYEYSIREMKGKTMVNEHSDAYFRLEQEGNSFVIRCIDETAANTGNTYTLKLKLTLANGTTCENTVNLPVKRTAVKLKLSTSKLSLNKTIAEAGNVIVTCVTNGYAFDVPVWQLMDRSGKISAEGKLDIGYENGKMTVAINDGTEYGATYKVLVKADNNSPAQTLTVTIPTEARSKITASLKVTGKLDVIRDGSALTITPSYKNCLVETGKMEELYIYSSADNFAEPVTDLFSIEPNGQGGYTVSRAESAELNPSLSYKLKLVTTIGDVKLVPAYASFKISMGSAKLTLVTEDATLFAKDKHDRVVFWFDTKDAALNDVTRVEIKDARYQQMFEILDYGDGTFAIGYKDGVVDSSLIGKSASKDVLLNLNTWLEGNQTAKANITVKLKLSVIK